MNFQMFKLDLEEVEEPEIKLPTFTGSLKRQESSRAGIIKKARKFEKNIYFCFIDNAKAFDCVGITTNCGKLLNRWEYQSTWPASWEICLQVKKQQLELDMEQQTGSK